VSWRLGCRQRAQDHSHEVPCAAFFLLFRVQAPWASTSGLRWQPGGGTTACPPAQRHRKHFKPHPASRRILQAQRRHPIQQEPHGTGPTYYRPTSDTPRHLSAQQHAQQRTHLRTQQRLLRHTQRRTQRPRPPVPAAAPGPGRADACLGLLAPGAPVAGILLERESPRGPGQAWQAASLSTSRYSAWCCAFTRLQDITQTWNMYLYGHVGSMRLYGIGRYVYCCKV